MMMSERARRLGSWETLAGREKDLLEQTLYVHKRFLGEIKKKPVQEDDYYLRVKSRRDVRSEL